MNNPPSMVLLLLSIAAAVLSETRAVAFLNPSGIVLGEIATFRVDIAPAANPTPFLK